MTEPTHSLVTKDLADLIARAPVDAEKMNAKRIFKGDGATLIRLTFDAGQVMREHSAPKPILVQVLDGHVTFTVGDDAVDMPTGAIIHVDARVMHEVTALVPSQVLLTMCG